MARMRCWVGVSAVCVLGAAGPLSAQELADLDYENLGFRGVGVDVGYIFPSRVEDTQAFGLRFDLGYAGPGLRIVPGITYWSSRFRSDEIVELEDRLGQLVAEQTGSPAPPIDLGRVDWTDIALSVDAHVVWAVPLGLLTYGGVGVAAHVLDGGGDAIDGTLIDDLLDQVSPSVNLHLGVELPLGQQLRIYSDGRYEVLEDLQYFRVRVGGQIMTGDNAPGEVR